jgi:hypothetical protein
MFKKTINIINNLRNYLILTYLLTYNLASLSGPNNANVVGFGMVINKSFMLLSNPNWNRLMNVTLSHEMSHANYLNSNAYTYASRDPWQKDCNLLVYVRSLSKSPKVIVNFLKNASKLFQNDDYHSNNSVN